MKCLLATVQTVVEPSNSSRADACHLIIENAFSYCCELLVTLQFINILFKTLKIDVVNIYYILQPGVFLTLDEKRVVITVSMNLALQA